MFTSKLKKNFQKNDLCAPSLKFRSIELRQKIVEAFLSSNLRQQCVNKTFAKTMFKPINRFVIYLGILLRINHCIDKS